MSESIQASVLLFNRMCSGSNRSADRKYGRCIVFLLILLNGYVRMGLNDAYIVIS